jgi:hypothetical protein
LLPDALQNQAYGLAKQAELNPTPRANDIAAISRKADEAITAAKQLGIDVPRHYRLTSVRMCLMRGDWKQALADLKILRDGLQSTETTWPLSSRAELELLLAAAGTCGGQHNDAEASLVRYRQLAGSLPDPEHAQLRETYEITRLTRPCGDHSSTKMDGVP